MSFLKIGAGIQLRKYQKKILEVFDKGIRIIVLCWSRRCLSAHTKVLTVDGLVEAKDLSVGDKVVSYNDGYELSTISHVGIVSSPKAIIELDYGDERIRTSYDHPFYFNGVYAPLFLIVWGNLEASQRAKLKLLCEQYGESLDDQLEKCGTSGDYEASIRYIRLLQDSFQWTNYQDTQGSSKSVPSKSDWITAGKSYRQRQNEQSGGKLGVVYSPTELGAYDEAGASDEELGRKMWNAYTYITASFANQGFMEHSVKIQNWSKRVFGTSILKDSGEVSEEIGDKNKGRDNTRHLEKPNVEIFEAEPLYEITVEGNSNYFVGRRCLLNHNCGKTLLAWTLLIREALRKPGMYWYCFNNYSTARDSVWMAQTSEGIRFLDMIPKEFVLRINSSELEIELTNGSVIKLVGIEHVDRKMGAGLQGIVFDEYATLDPDNINLITPTLAQTGGWQLLISTPRGKNHFYKKYQLAKKHPEFMYANNLHCGMPEIAQYMAPGFLEQERVSIIDQYGNDALFQQEYLTSWITPNSGSVFGDLLGIMKREGRVAPIAQAEEDVCYTAWDLGNADHTAIVYFRVNEQGGIDVLDTIEARNETVDYYIEEIEARNWQVTTHFLPHDGAYHKGPKNQSYLEVMNREHNLLNVAVLKKPNTVRNKLDYLRRLFSRSRINEACTRALECLEKLEYEWNSKNKVWSSTPTHKGGYSDLVDALCYSAQAVSQFKLLHNKAFLLRGNSSATALTPEQAKDAFLNDFLEGIFSDKNKKSKKDNNSVFNRLL